MESLIALRGSYRSAFTIFTDKIQDFLKQKNCNFDSCADFFVQLEVKYSKIKCLDKDILSMMQESEKYSKEVLEMEMKGILNYNKVFVDLKMKLIRQVNLSYLNTNETSQKIFTGLKTKLKQPLYLSNDNPNKTNKKVNIVNISTSIKRELPQIQFQTFDGNLKNWLQFWKSFKKIHEDKSISEVDKFTYLLQSIQKGSRAREVIESLTSENYQQAIEFLHSRFSKEDVLIEVHIREILSLVVYKSLGQEHKLSVRKFYEKIEASLKSLTMLGFASDKYAFMLYPFVEYSLPVDILRTWRRVLNAEPLRSDKKNPNKLEMLMQFLRNIIHEKEKINLTKGAFGLGKQTAKKMKISVTPVWNC